MFIEYNVNPKKRKTGDCVIRAVAAAAGITWEEAYRGLALAGFKRNTAMNDPDAVDEFLTSIGFKVGKIKVTKGVPRIKVREFAELHKDWRAVLRVAGHMTACGNGNYIDTWDCGDHAVYKFWYRDYKLR